MRLLRRHGVWLLLAVGATLPLLTSNAYYVHSVMSKVCIYAILVAGLDLVVGYAGDVSVGHAGLFAVGAYTAAIAMTQVGLPFPLAAGLAVLLAAVFGLALGFPALRLSGPYLAVATIAFGLIIQTFINEAVWLTRGSQGIQGIGPLYGAFRHLQQFVNEAEKLWFRHPRPPPSEQNLTTRTTILHFTKIM